jgi:hypothetical protein
MRKHKRDTAETVYMLVKTNRCYMGFVVDKLTLELAFLLVLQFPQYNHINPPHPYLIHLS